MSWSELAVQPKILLRSETTLLFEFPKGNHVGGVELTLNRTYRNKGYGKEMGVLPPRQGAKETMDLP